MFLGVVRRLEFSPCNTVCGFHGGHACVEQHGIRAVRTMTLDIDADRYRTAQPQLLCELGPQQYMHNELFTRSKFF